MTRVVTSSEIYHRLSDGERIAEEIRSHETVSGDFNGDYDMIDQENKSVCPREY